MMRTFTLSAAVATMPDDLQDLLVREAYLKKSSDELTRLRDKTLSEEQVVSASRPPFLFLREKNVRKAFKLAELSVSRDLQTLERALHVNDELSRRMNKRALSSLQDWLPSACVDFKVALAAEQIVAQWELVLMKFVDHLRLLVRRLGVARNTAAGGYDHERGRLSTAAWEQLEECRLIAVDMEQEIATANELAEQQITLVKGSYFDEPLPKLELDPYAESISSIPKLAPGHAQAEFGRLRMSMKTLIAQELDILRARMSEADARQAERKRAYVRAAWEQLHAHALRSVDPSQLDAVVAELEQDLANEIANGSAAPWGAAAPATAAHLATA